MPSRPVVLAVCGLLCLLTLGCGFFRSRASHDAPRPPAPPSAAVLGIDYAPETLVIWQVLPGSEADLAGLHVGDRLMAVEGLPLRQAGDEQRIVQRKQPGEKVLVTVQRGGLQITTQVLLHQRGR